MSARIGIVGFGEAGCSIGAGLVDFGARVVAYDARLGTPEEGDLASRAARSGTTLATDVAALVDEADVILSLVTAVAAEPVARRMAPHLRPGQLVADLNSTSPGLAQRIARIVAQTGADFADVAVMAAVPPRGHRVPMLASGSGARRFATLGLGMQVEVVGDEPGAASAVKMLRSLLVKGLEALLLEFGIAARRYGATERVLASMNGALPMQDWQELATYLLSRTAVHGERRGHELEEVAAMLRELDIEPHLAGAGARRLLWAAERGLPARFAGEPPRHYDEVLSALEVDEP